MIFLKTWGLLFKDYDICNFMIKLQNGTRKFDDIQKETNL